MRSIRYGVAGIDTEDLEGSIKSFSKAGYAACEVQFVREFTLKEKECARLGEIARDEGMTLSVHAPYFAALTTKEEDRAKQHAAALHHACKLGEAMGATVVVAHPGSLDGAEPDELHERIDRSLRFLGPRIGDLEVKLGLETCGRKSQFGALGDISMVCRRFPFVAPVVDFAHIHAVSGGSLKSAEAYRALFTYIAAEFSTDQLWPLHCHFTDNQYGPQGEIKHLPYGTGSLSAAQLIEGAQGFDIDITMISESKDPDSHRLILEDLQRSKAPLVTKKQKPKPRSIPLEKRGDAHYYVSGDNELRITNWNKPFFPEGHTKGDLIDHYYRVGLLMLPFLRERPIVMQRVPDGIDGERFYEKQAPKGRPDWIRTTPVLSDGGSRTIDYVVVDDVATLCWLAQIASVECHAWTARLPNLDEPDFAVIDLDPHEPISFDEVRTVAGLVKVVLDRLNLIAFPKTSGGAGLQVFIPLVAGHTYPEVRKFCSEIGRLIKHAYPDGVTLETTHKKRAGKVYVDANQNAKGKTLVAPYSVRPYPGATVSTPLAWEEIEDEFYPEQFTIKTIGDRLDEVGGDLFRGAVVHRQDIHLALERLSG